LSGGMAEKISKEALKKTLADFDDMRKKAAILKQAAQKLSTEETHLPRVIERFKKELAEMEAEIKKIKESKK